jgi:hypothetical protein
MNKTESIKVIESTNNNMNFIVIISIILSSAYFFTLVFLCYISKTTWMERIDKEKIQTMINKLKRRIKPVIVDN